MRHPRNHPDRPTTCDISDLLNEIVAFVNENPLWADDPESMTKLVIAYGILTNMSSPDMVTDDEYEFIIDLHNKIKETTNG